jgi:hypothetical protein
VAVRGSRGRIDSRFRIRAVTQKADRATPVCPGAGTCRVTWENSSIGAMGELHPGDRSGSVRVAMHVSTTI